MADNIEIPRIVIPKKKIAPVKFVQLYVNKEPYLRTGDIFDSHASILETALMEFGIEFETGKNNINEDIPLLRGVKYLTPGMGSAIIIDGEFDVNALKSSDYNIGVNRKHLIKIQPYTELIFKIRGRLLKNV